MGATRVFVQRIMHLYDGQNHFKIGLMTWLCVCFWTHVIPTQHSLTTSSFWYICMYLLMSMFMSPTQLNDVITSWRASWRQKVYDVKNTSSRQNVCIKKFVIWRQKHIMSKTRHDIKRFVMTSKIRHYLKKVRHNIKNMLWHHAKSSP